MFVIAWLSGYVVIY